MQAGALYVGDLLRCIDQALARHDDGRSLQPIERPWSSWISRRLSGLKFPFFPITRNRTTPEGETGGKRLIIDHFADSEESYVRGLICDRCNAVMACVDGRKRWGVNRAWEAAARSYAANAWQSRNGAFQTEASGRPIVRD
ncbi:hypothetical protein [Streptomyces indicus]|uniref:Uncharacterized protein n=1 Tax=Streptomyces indicus TaxID=417292 RepID=A0A1G8ZX64_9ACTN|nr:hypothetical protein [Streptomyces indicus]SDK19234.1 hypothetical protein SAMN05421806_105223 [Streptomyces indicus]